MLFQVHDTPHTTGGGSGFSKWKGESHINDGPYGIIGGDWLSVGESCDFVRAFANHSDAGLAKVAAVIDPLVALRVQALLEQASHLARANAALIEEREAALVELDRVVVERDAVKQELESLREETAALQPLNELAAAIIAKPAKPKAKS